MSVVLLVSVFAAGLLLGVFGAYRWLKARAYLVCQRQALLDRGPRPVVADGYNPVRPLRRRRSPDEQAIWQDFPNRVSRPVFYD